MSTDEILILVPAASNRLECGAAHASYRSVLPRSGVPSEPPCFPEPGWVSLPRPKRKPRSSFASPPPPHRNHLTHRVPRLTLSKAPGFTSLGTGRRWMLEKARISLPTPLDHISPPAGDRPRAPPLRNHDSM